MNTPASKFASIAAAVGLAAIVSCGKKSPIEKEDVLPHEAPLEEIHSNGTLLTSLREPNCDTKHKLYFILEDLSKAIFCSPFEINDPSWSSLKFSDGRYYVEGALRRDLTVQPLIILSGEYVVEWQLPLYDIKKIVTLKEFPEEFTVITNEYGVYYAPNLAEIARICGDNNRYIVPLDNPNVNVTVCAGLKNRAASYARNDGSSLRFEARKMYATNALESRPNPFYVTDPLGQPVYVAKSIKKVNIGTPHK